MNTKKKQFKTFDPNPSFKLALELLSTAKVKKFALIGRLAMWVYIEDESLHKYTKDVDFAILTNDLEKLIKIVKKRKISYRNLQIGGIGIREEGISIDFIDRRLHDIQNLFSEAINSAKRYVNVDQFSIPVVTLEHLVAMKMVSGEPKDDEDLKLLLSLPQLKYKKARELVDRFLSSITTERLDVFARDAGALPKRGPYKYK